jgi:hypothetical protein
MWVKLRFDIGSNAKDLFDSAEQSARHARIQMQSA